MTDSMRGTVEIHGLKELEQRLFELPEEVRGKVLFSTLMAAAKPMLEHAQSLAPVASEPHKVGRVGKKRRGSRVEVQPGNLRRGIKLKRLKQSDHSATVVLGFSKLAYYGRFYEFGTSKTPAQPMLRPAFEATKDEVLGRIKKILASRINSRVRKMAKERARARR